MSDKTPDKTQRCSICKRPYPEHGAPCELCGRAPEHHEPGEKDDEWRAKARMAHARQAAGVELADVDREAVKRHPEMPPLVA